MGKFIKGDVVVIPFPFTDLSSSKKRPAIVLADIKGNDYFMLQVTSKKDSNIRPNKIFTLDGNLVLYKIGHLTKVKTDACVQKVCNIIKT